MLKWAAQRGYLTADAAIIDPPATVGAAHRLLSRDELAAVLPVLRASRRPYAAALRFMLLTLTRRQENGLARWGDVDIGAGDLDDSRDQEQPAAHSAPLPDRQWTCCGRSSPKSLGRSLIFATSTGAAAWQLGSGDEGLARGQRHAGWTRHDLRRTGATMLGEMGELPDIIEAALNHVSIRPRWPRPTTGAVSAPGGGGAATAGGRAGRDRGGGGKNYPTPFGGDERNALA